MQQKKQKFRLAVVEGDGIGPEVIPEAKKVLEKVSASLGLHFDYEAFPFSADEYLRTGRTLTPKDLDRFRNEFDGIFFGALGDPRIPDNRHAREILLGMRFGLDLYVNFRPVRLLDSKFCPLKNKDEKNIQFVIFRENTEDLYRGIGGAMNVDTENEIAIENMVNSRKGVERILRAACEYAIGKKLNRICMVDKSNAIQYGHGLWQRVWKLIQKDYPLEYRHLYVDAAVMEMVRAPEQFDVIVTTNLFGDILSDLGAQLQGGMGLAASVNYNPTGAALFEPVHGSAPNLAGKNQANPLAAILTVGLIFDHFGYPEGCKKIEAAVKRALRENIVTPDLGGGASTKAVGEYICKEVGQ